MWTSYWKCTSNLHTIPLPEYIILTCDISPDGKVRSDTNVVAVVIWLPCYLAHCSIAPITCHIITCNTMHPLCQCCILVNY